MGQGRTGIKRKVRLAPPSQKKDIIGPDSSRPKPIIIGDEAVLVVDLTLSVPLSKLPRNGGSLPYILPRPRPPPKPPDQLINK